MYIYTNKFIYIFSNYTLQLSPLFLKNSDDKLLFHVHNINMRTMKYSYLTERSAKGNITFVHEKIRTDSFND